MSSDIDNFAQAIEMPNPNPDTSLRDLRRHAMLVLGRAAREDIARGLGAMAAEMAFVDLREPEVGLVMLRGRIRGDGAPFNMGEASVTRAAVRLSSGETGFAYVLGRDTGKARLMALCDALLQSDRWRASVERELVAPFEAAQMEARARRQRQTAATRVDFVTLVRGDDAA